jgi:hypothetical protein
MDFSKVELPETAPNMQFEIPEGYKRTKDWRLVTIFHLSYIL